MSHVTEPVHAYLECAHTTDSFCFRALFYYRLYRIRTVNTWRFVSIYNDLRWKGEGRAPSAKKHAVFTEQEAAVYREVISALAHVLEHGQDDWGYAPDLVKMIAGTREETSRALRAIGLNEQGGKLT